MSVANRAEVIIRDARLSDRLGNPPRHGAPAVTDNRISAADDCTSALAPLAIARLGRALRCMQREPPDRGPE